MQVDKIKVDRTNKTLHLMKPHILGWSMPLIVEGRGAILWDSEGNHYIDCDSGPGVMNIGHCHPQFIDAMEAQIKKLVISPGKLLHIPLIELNEELIKIVPKSLKKSIFCNSGTEACELAVKLAKRHSVMSGKTGNYIVSLENSFHGFGGLSLTLTGQKRFRKKAAGYSIYPGILHIPSPYCYRCNLEYPECGIYCARALENISVNTRGAEDIAALIYEPIQGSGGIIVPPKEYHQMIGSICKENGITLIVDEVFTGFGRTGTMFACEHWGIEPDIMAMAKAIAAGFPMGAIMMTDEIANSFEPSDQGFTFGGSPIACSAAVANIKIINSQKLAERALRIGSFMIKELKALNDEGILKGDVRGLGLAIGVELVKDDNAKTPDAQKATKLKISCMKQGILLGISGCFENVIRIHPPLTISEEQAAKVVQVIKQCLESL